MHNSEGTKICDRNERERLRTRIKKKRRSGV
jgi:hypothetical protein